MVAGLLIVSQAALAFVPTVAHNTNPKLAEVENTNPDLVTEGFEVFWIGVGKFIEHAKRLVNGAEAVFKVTDGEAEVA